MTGKTRLHEDLEAVKERLLWLCGQVENSVSLAVKATEKRDYQVAREVVRADADIDSAEVEIEELCLEILATQQPVASDLRFVVTILKVNNDLERIGDLATNMAKRAKYLSERDPVQAPFDFKEMARKTRAMLKDALDALVNKDQKLANAVLLADDEIDKMNREMYDNVFAAIRSDPNNLESYIHYMSVCRHFERIADYTTNIAEDVIYLVTGQIVRHGSGLEDF